MTIIGYKMDQMIPIVDPGGVHEGFMSPSYQTLQVDSGGISIPFSLHNFE